MNRLFIKNKKSLIPLLFGILASCGGPEPLEEGGATERPRHPYGEFQGGESAGEKNFATLINSHAKGQPDRTPWIGSFWPHVKNGIAQSTGRGSPASKYDATHGGSQNSQAQSWEVAKHGSRVPRVQGWWGHCNGWCVAAALFPEPRETVDINGVLFTPDDIKGLLSETGMFASADYFGERVDPWDPERNLAVQDTAPNQYFLVLTHYMGKQKRVVLIDRYTTDQVWNQPLAGYRFDYPKPDDYKGPSPEAPNVYRIEVTSKIWWMKDFASPTGDLTDDFNWDSSNGAQVESRVLRMELWLDAPVVFDAEGKITSSGNLIVAREGKYFVGGDWRNGGIHSTAHPDYMWVPYSVLDPDPTDDDPPSNIHIQPKWVIKHLVNKEPWDGQTGPVDPAPDPIDDPFPFPSDGPTPQPTRTHRPSPRPTPSSSPRPTPTLTLSPRPTSTPIPEPTPTFTIDR